MHAVVLERQTENIGYEWSIIKEKEVARYDGQMPSSFENCAPTALEDKEIVIGVRWRPMTT